MSAKEAGLKPRKSLGILDRPAMSAAAGVSDGGENSENLRVARRRLSVVSDNKLIEGVSLLSVNSESSMTASKPASKKDSEVYPGQHKANSEGIPTGEPSPEPIPPPEVIVTSFAGFSKKGYAPYNPRKKNQDALIMAEDSKTGSLLLVVLDGHGEAGDKVAQAFRHSLAPAIFAHPQWEIDIKVAMEECILRLEEGLIADPTVDTDFSGSTLVAACIRGTTVTVANVGDSRVILGIKTPLTSNGRTVKTGEPKYELVAEALSIDHKPDLEGEKERILEAGGRVFAVEYEDGVGGPQRVWLGHMDVPGLAMSRSLGDQVAHTAGVTSTPEFFVRELDLESEGTPCLLMLATDGLWEFMSNEECLSIACAASEPRAAVAALITEANERWMREEQVIDDTTVCVAFLRGWTGGPGWDT